MAATDETREQRPAVRPARARSPHLGPERRRPLVLDAAFELLLERGYEGASMEAIAEAAGVSKPVVYACYASKEELFKSLFQREEARVLGQIADALARAGPLDDPERVLVDGLTAFLRAVADSPHAYRVVMLGEGGATAAVARRIQRGREMQVRAIASIARVWLEREGSSIDPDVAAQLIGQAVVGVAEAGARALLGEADRWTPESLGLLLGRLAATGQAVLLGPPRDA